MIDFISRMNSCPDDEAFDYDDDDGGEDDDDDDSDNLSLAQEGRSKYSVAQVDAPHAIESTVFIFSLLPFQRMFPRRVNKRICIQPKLLQKPLSRLRNQSERLRNEDQ